MALMPHDLPPWEVVYQQARRWMKAGCFEDMAHDLREIARLIQGRAVHPTTVIMDGRTMQSSPESGADAARSRTHRDDAGALRRLRSQDKDITLLITESNPKLLETFADVTLTIERGEIEGSGE